MACGLFVTSASMEITLFETLEKVMESPATKFIEI